MKHLNFVAMIVVMAMSLVSCSRSPQDKAEALVAEAMKMSLYVPESYEPLATQIDSAFAPYASPEFYDKVIEFMELSDELEDCERDMKWAKSSMLSSKEIAHWSEYSRNEYEDDKAEYEECVAKYDDLQSEREKLKDEIYEIASGQEEFIGYHIFHRFRCKNNANMSMVSDMLFLVDKDMVQILASYDAEEQEFEDFIEALDVIKENLSAGETDELIL